MADIFSFAVLPYDKDTTLSNRTLQVSLRLLEPILPFDEDEPSTLSLQCPCCLKRVLAQMGMNRERIAAADDVDHDGYHTYRCFNDGNGPNRTLHNNIPVLIWERALRHARHKILHEPSGHLLLSEKRPDAIVLGSSEVFLDVHTCDIHFHD